MHEVLIPTAPDSVPVVLKDDWQSAWRGAKQITNNDQTAFKIANVATRQMTGVRASPLWNAVWRATYSITEDDATALEIANASGGKGAIKSMSVAGHHKLASLVHKQGGALKSTYAGRRTPQRGLVEGYLITWGNQRDHDLEREFFTPHTLLCLDWFSERPILYHHGMDKKISLKTIGGFKKYEVDDLGLWIQGQLNMVEQYAEAVYGLVNNGQSDPRYKMGWSSGSVEHLVQVAENGEILRWPLIEGSITPTPAQPSKTTVYAGGIKMSPAALKSILNISNDSFDVLRGLQASGADTGNSLKSTGDIIMPRVTRSTARAVLKQYGIRASDEELEEVAANAEDDLATMSDEDEYSVASDDAYMMDDDDAMMFDDDDAMMFDDDDDAMMFDDDDAMMMDDEDADVASWGFRSETMPTDDTINARSGQVAPETLNAMRRANRRKSYQIKSLYRRLKAIESSVPEMEMGVGRGGLSPAVKSRWDNDSGYTEAFKSYMRRGLAGLYDWERQSLYGRGADRQFGKADTQYDPATKSLKVLNTSSDSSVGFAVPPEWVNELNKNIMSATVMAGECRTRTTNSDQVLIPDLRTTDARRVHSANVSWVGETPSSGNAHRASEMQIGQIAIPVHVMLISQTATLTSLEDVSFDLQGEITEAFSEASAIAYDTLIWGGDGQGKLSGIVSNTDVIGHLSAGIETVGGYIPAGSTTEIPSGDVLIEMMGHLPPAYQRTAKWYMNTNTLIKVRQLKDGNANYLWNTGDNGLNSGMPTELLGYPVVVNVFADNIAANGYPIVFGALNQGYTIAQRVEFSVRRFDEVRADLDQVLFIGRARIGGQVTQPAGIKVLKMSAA